MKTKHQRPRIKRPTWDEYFLELARLVSKRATCLRRKVGAVLVKDKRLLATGYNGAPKGLEDCLERGYCIRERKGLKSGERLEYCRAVHAEQNAIVQAAYSGIATENTTLYTTHFPCIICAKQLINAGIREMVYENEEIDELSSELLSESAVKVRKFSK